VNGNPVVEKDMVMRTLIKNGRVVTAVDDYRADILIEDGKVVGDRSPPPF